MGGEFKESFFWWTTTKRNYWGKCIEMSCILKSNSPGINKAVHQCGHKLTDYILKWYPNHSDY